MQERAIWKVKLECAARKAGHAAKIGVCGFMVLVVSLTLAYTIIHLAVVVFNG